KDHYVLVASDGTEIRAKAFPSSSISSSEPGPLNLGSGSKVNPHAASNLGIGGQRSGTNTSPERLLVAYENGGDIFAVPLDEGMNVLQSPQNVSTGIATANRMVEMSSDVHDFLAVWSGQASGNEDVFAKRITSSSSNILPTAPSLLTPND